jgi:large subunit ribosomal protein L6
MLQTGTRSIIMEKSVEIPDGITVKLEGRELVVSGPRGELRKNLRGSPVKIDLSQGKATFSTESERRKIKTHSGTWAAHLRNMITGVTQGWEARLKVVYSHFPIKFSVEGNSIKIGNFLGERKDRMARIKGDVKVEVQKDTVILTGNDREEVGQAAALIELTAKVRGYDKRVFQDGIHLIQKTAPIQEEAKEGEQHG